MIIRVAFAGICSSALVLAACTNGVESPTGPGRIPQPTSAIVYTALGASDTAGVGSSAPCIPLTDCPEGRGYVQLAARDLGTRGFSVTLYNLGFPAMVLSRRIQDLGAQYGRSIPGNIIERQAPVVFTTTTLVTIFAGPNDVDSIVAALGGGAGSADQMGYINNQIQLFAQEFDSLIGMVRVTVPNARVIALNMPNMAGMPRSAGVSVQQRRAQH